MANKGGTLLTRISNGVGHIAFSNPARRNAVTADMLEQLAELIPAWEADASVRVLALSGDGPVAFSAGLDIFGLADEAKRQRVRDHFEGGPGSALRRLQLCNKPTIACIEGFCFGAGVSISVLCDLRVASASASFCIPAARMGIGYSLFGVQTLVESVGTLAAREVLFSAHRYSAAEAQGIGLINRVFPADHFQADAASYVATIAGGAPLTIAAAKLAVRAVAPRPDPAGLDLVLAAIERAGNSEDFLEGQRAFAEKRSPRFSGR
jgi:enoyl-CoA hydratase/carnithine racemase